MGEVYRARDTRLGREVAVKVLPEQFASDPNRRARFEGEARAVAALSHPNILALYDYGTDGTITYVVLELLEGGTLRDPLAKGPFPGGRPSPPARRSRRASPPPTPRASSTAT
jgi:serine/threonine protein kinase